MKFVEVFLEWVQDPRDPWVYEWIKEEERKLLSVVRKGKILDVGCGFGRILELLKDRGEVYGIDIDRYQVELARSNGLNAIVADARDNPFPNEYFDYVLIVNNTLGNIQLGKIRVLKEAYRVLKRGGTGIISVYNDTPETLEHRLNSYRAYGLDCKVVGGFIVKCSGGLYSEQFSPQHISRLVQLAGIRKYRIETLGRIGFWLEFGK